jgi:hypothetical protein
MNTNDPLDEVRRRTADKDRAEGAWLLAIRRAALNPRVERVALAQAAGISRSRLYRRVLKEPQP